MTGKDRPRAGVRFTFWRTLTNAHPAIQLVDAVYGGFADEVNATIRAEAFGEEIASGKT